MKYKPRSIIILIVLLFVFLFGSWQNCQAIDLLLDYPEIPGAGRPEEATSLPEFIRYIYMFSLGAAGFVALLAILIGAIMYIFSAGKPDKAKDAKDRIMSALLGIIILLASVLILRTINPDLVNIGFKLPIINKVTNYTCYCCCYTFTECDPLSKPEYKRWCSTNLTQSQADKDCADECDYYHCPWSLWQNYSSKVVAEPCE